MKNKISHILLKIKEMFKSKINKTIFLSFSISLILIFISNNSTDTQKDLNQGTFDYEQF